MGSFAHDMAEYSRRFHEAERAAEEAEAYAAHLDEHFGGVPGCPECDLTPVDEEPSPCETGT